MSVLKNKRYTSPMKYVSNGYEIEKYSLDFTKRLTVKNSRLFQDPIKRLAMFQADTAYIANEIFPTNRAEFLVRRIILGLSMATLHALDKRMADVYEVLMVNPSEAFNRKNGKPIPKAEAEQILDTMAEDLGCMIDLQDTLIKGVRDSDRSRAAKLPPDDSRLTSTLTDAFTAMSKSLITLFIN